MVVAVCTYECLSPFLRCCLSSQNGCCLLLLQSKNHCGFCFCLAFLFSVVWLSYTLLFRGFVWIQFFSIRVRFIHLIFQLLTFNLVEILVQKLVESFCDFFSLGQTRLHRTEFMVDNFRREFFVVTLLLSFFSVCFCYSLICDYWPRTSAPNAIEKSNLWPFGQEERSLIRPSYFCRLYYAVVRYPNEIVNICIFLFI